jgi:putative transposase
MIVLNDKHLRLTLQAYFQYYDRTRTHLGLDKDAPKHRPSTPPSAGTIVPAAEVGGLHHRYERRAA